MKVVLTFPGSLWTNPLQKGVTIQMKAIELVGAIPKLIEQYFMRNSLFMLYKVILTFLKLEDDILIACDYLKLNIMNRTLHYCSISRSACDLDQTSLNLGIIAKNP